MTAPKARNQDFEPHRLEASSGEVVSVESGDFAGKYLVKLGGVAEGFADDWSEVRMLLDSWLPGREWQVDGLAWVREKVTA